MRDARSHIPPFINIMRPGYRQWIWRVHIDVNSNGYVSTVLVVAVLPADGEATHGRATASLTAEDDLHEAIEQLAIEACLDAIEEVLPGHEKPPRTLKGPFQRQQLTASHPGGRR
jgi:hypothetical protein